MNNVLLNPKNLYNFASKIEDLETISEIDCVYGYEIEDKVLASAISNLSKKPLITDELLRRCEMNQLEESFSVLIIAFEIKTSKNLVKKIKEIRNLGFEVNKLVSWNRTSPEVEAEFRMMGIKIISVR